MKNTTVSRKKLNLGQTFQQNKIILSWFRRASTLFDAMRMNAGISDWSGLYKQWSKMVEHLLMEQ